MNAADVHLVLFLSRATPLTRWARMGILQRETALYKALAARLGQISILTSGGREELQYQDELGSIEILYNRWGLSPNLYSLLSPYLHRAPLQKATVLKTNQLDGAWTALIAGFLHHKPVIVRAGYLWAELNRQSGSNSLKAALIDQLQAWGFRRAQAIFLTSQGMAEQVSQNYSIPREKIRVIPNYVDTETFRPLPEAQPIQGRVCTVGRLHPVKNLESLIEACSQLPGLELILIGDGEQRQQLENLARETRARVSFLGALPHEQIPTQINRAELFVLPSLFEGHPKALIEAMACGIAVVGADVPGIREAIQHGQTGWLCPSSPEEIREAIQYLLEHHDLRAALSRNARQFIEDNLSLQRIAELELNTIMEVIHAAQR